VRAVLSDRRVDLPWSNAHARTTARSPVAARGAAARACAAVGAVGHLDAGWEISDGDPLRPGIYDVEVRIEATGFRGQRMTRRVTIAGGRPAGR
jgi:hypothetical protein